MKVKTHFIICDDRTGDDIYEMEDGSFVWRYWMNHPDCQRHWNETFKRRDVGRLFDSLLRRWGVVKIRELASVQPFYDMKPEIEAAVKL